MAREFRELVKSLRTFSPDVAGEIRARLGEIANELRQLTDTLKSMNIDITRQVFQNHVQIYYWLTELSYGASNVYSAAADFNASVAAVAINDRAYKSMLSCKDDEFDKKKELVKEINRELNKIRASIVHPVTGQPVNLYANASPDGKGRYLLEDRKTKKRSHSSDTLTKLLPLKIRPYYAD